MHLQVRNLAEENKINADSSATLINHMYPFLDNDMYGGYRFNMAQKDETKEMRRKRGKLGYVKQQVFLYPSPNPHIAAYLFLLTC